MISIGVTRWVTDREREKERIFRRRVSKAWSIGTRKCVFGVVYLWPTNPVAKWNAIIGSYVCVVTLLYSSRACCEITSDSRFINMVNEHRLPFAWTMFDPLIISLRTSNRFNGLTDRVTTTARPVRISLCRAMLLAKTDCGKIKTVAQTKQTLFRIEFPPTSFGRLAIRPVCFAKLRQLDFEMTVSN